MSAATRLFVVGCPRSGTTWLQILCQLHPLVRTGRETHLFDRYLAHLAAAFDVEAQNGSEDGLKAYVTRQEFDREILRTVADVVLERFGARDGEVLLEKTPAHLLHIQVVHRAFPEAYVLHIIRDPRAVVASWQAAGKEPWGGWARSDAVNVAAFWRGFMDRRDEAARLFGDRYREIRYEDLHAETSRVMVDLFAWLGLGHDPAVLSRIESLGIADLKAGPSFENARPIVSGADRATFFRTGCVDSWKEELTASQIDAVALGCGDFMRALGYLP